jgi:excisionase family DNA binding protein
MSAERLHGDVRAVAREALDRRPRPLISVREAADLLGIPRSVAYRWAKAKRLPGLVTVGARYYVKRLVLLAWLAEDGPGAAPMPDELHAARRG